MRRSPAEATVLLASFPARREAAQTSAVENDDGSTTFVYDRYHCRTSAWDVLKVVDP